MQGRTIGKCKLHSGQKLKKLCQKCWVQVCSKCTIETHKGHKAIDWQVFLNEAKQAKEKLIQARSGDILSVKKLIESTSTLRTRLNETEDKRKTSIKDIEQKVISKIKEIAKNVEGESLRLNGESVALLEKLKELCTAHMHEVGKIPELADAVISQGTIEDLKTFIEMCQKGTEVNSEILEYKKIADDMKKTVEDFISTNPFKFLLPFNEPLKPKELSSKNSDTLNSFLEDNELEMTVNESLRNFEGTTSLSDTFNYSINVKESALPRINSSVELYKKNAKFTIPKNFLASQPNPARGSKSNIRTFKSYTNSQTHSRRNSIVSVTNEENKKLPKNSKHQVNSSTMVMSVKNETAKKRSSAKEALNKTMLKAPSKSALAVRKPVLTKKTTKKRTIEDVKASIKNWRNELKSIKEQILNTTKFSTVEQTIKQLQQIAIGKKTCINILKNFVNNLLEQVLLNYNKEQQALSKLPIDRILKHMHSNHIKNIISTKKIREEDPGSIYEIKENYEILNEKYLILKKRIKGVAKEMVGVKEAYNLVNSTCGLPLLRCVKKNYDTAFKKLFISCRKIIKEFKDRDQSLILRQELSIIDKSREDSIQNIFKERDEEWSMSKDKSGTQEEIQQILLELDQDKLNNQSFKCVRQENTKEELEELKKRLQCAEQEINVLSEKCTKYHTEYICFNNIETSIRRLINC